ncbi:catalase/peroxidase HPI [Phytophthora cinnamomi]|uniref:catalase/peroxidase HPI n=1 Tax=Phytophthora cinnamomi TaxID=4785 RepID=UPI003559DE34|nr:catalase/peroxidase HPI [Phytophthora cinnamomi]
MSRRHRTQLSRLSCQVPATPRCFSPQKNWTVNGGVDKIISALEPVKESYPTLSTADMVVLAGQVALEDAGYVTIDFLGDRTDANNGNGTECSFLNETWTEASEKEYKAEGKGVYLMETDLALLATPELKEVVQLFASEDAFKHVLNST